MSGTVAELEEQLNRLLNDYVALVWNFAPVGGEMHGTVVMIAVSELRKQQLMNSAPMGRPI